MGKGDLWCRVVDRALLVYLVVQAVVAPILHSPACLPGHVVPAFSVEFRTWFIETFDDYLLSEKPHFVVGILYLELFFQWPLALAFVYAVATTNYRFIATTSLIYGVSVISISAAPVFELILSKRGSGKMFMILYTYLGFGVLAFFRGLFAAVIKGQGGPAVQHTKKRA